MGQQGRRTLGVLGFALAVWAWAASGAAAAPTWLEPVPLSSPPQPQAFLVLGAGTPDVALDGSGNVVGAWQRLSDGGAAPVVQVTSRAPGAGFAGAVDIGPTVFSAAGWTDGPMVELDAGGSATLAFTSDDGRVKVASRPAGGTFSGPEEISTGTANKQVDLDVSPAGHAVVGWYDGTNLQVATRAPGGTFAAPTNLGPANGAAFAPPQVAINDQGAAVVAWVEPDAVPHDIVRARVRTADSTFAAAPEQLLSDAGQDATAPDVAIDAQGRATAIWERFDGANDIVESKQSTVAGDFPLAEDPVSDTGVDGNLPQVVVDAENTAVAVWTSGSTVTGASRQSNASFSDPQPISAAGMNTSLPPRVAVDAAGNVLAVWAPSGVDASIQASRRPKGGVFGGVDLIPRGPADLVWGPAVEFDNEGNALVLWSGRENADDKWTVYGSAYDVAPPSLGAVAVPATATAGQGVGMAAAATDRWSPVSLSWSFGDGTSATGGAVTHAFGSVGAFTVTATATDAVGNASSATRSILVTPAAPPPGPPRITSRVRASWGVSGKRLYLLRLSMGSVPKGGKGELRCSGKRCPFKRKSSKRRRRGAITLFKEIKASKASGKRSRGFRAKQRLEVRITAPGFIGKVVRYKLKAGKIPSGKVLCLPPGAKKPRKRC